jgi:6-phosphogluconolactonase
MHGTLEVVPDVPQAFRELVVGEAPGSIALSGGDTARRCYELLATAPVDWSEVDAFIGDERWVPVSDPDSNEGMARTTFLDQVGVHAVHSMRHAGSTIEDAADAYDALLRDLQAIDLVHLGLGPDGHTASLFPGSPALEVRDRLVVATGDDEHPHPRLTIPYPAIAAARLVVFTVSGIGKREALERVQLGDDLPAAKVRADRVVWLVDHAAMGDANGL